MAGATYGRRAHPVTYGASGDWLSTLEEYAPAVSAVVGEFTDPCKQAAVLKARLQNLQARNAPMAIRRTVRARMEAATAACGTKRGEQEVEEGWRNLVGVGIGAAVLVAGAGAFFLVMKGLQ